MKAAEHREIIAYCMQIFHEIKKHTRIKNDETNTHSLKSSQIHTRLNNP